MRSAGVLLLIAAFAALPGCGGGGRGLDFVLGEWGLHEYSASLNGPRTPVPAHPYFLVGARFKIIFEVNGKYTEVLSFLRSRSRERGKWQRVDGVYRATTWPDDEPKAITTDYHHQGDELWISTQELDGGRGDWTWLWFRRN